MTGSLGPSAARPTGTDGGDPAEPADPEEDDPTADGSTADGSTADGSTADGSTADGSTAAGPAAAGPAADGAVMLPDRVRQRVLSWSADALGRMPPDRVPPPLRAAARFTPAKRVRLAGTALAATLESDPAFRLAAAEWVEREAPDAVAAVRAGETPPAADPAELAAAAYLLRPPGWSGYLTSADAALRAATQSAAAADRDAELARLRAELELARAAGREEAERSRAALGELRAELDSVRRRLRAETGLRRAEERARLAAAEVLADARRRAATAESAAQADARRLRQRLAEAEDAVEAARRASRESRQVDEVRLWLLLDTATNAVQGLRRELALAPSEDRPADAVRAAAGRPDLPGARGEDPEVLDRLLELPRAHLIVDGYNVTKGGYGDLPLASQRGRLVQGLGALAARTGVEVSCVFDGAERPPVMPPSPRGVRVLFSDPGETADDLIRRLVAVEPGGRPLVVVSSDREVADDARRQRAYPVPSALLLRRLDRG